MRLNCVTKHTHTEHPHSSRVARIPFLTSHLLHFNRCTIRILHIQLAPAQNALHLSLAVCVDHLFDCLRSLRGDVFAQMWACGTHRSDAIRNRHRTKKYVCIELYILIPHVSIVSELVSDDCCAAGSWQIKLAPHCVADQLQTKTWHTLAE